MNATEFTRVLRLLQAVFAVAVLDQLGRDQGQMQRSRTITPSALAFGLIATMATLDVDTLADLHRGFNATNEVATTYKPFWNQLAKPQFPRFAHALFAHLMAHLTQPVLEALPGTTSHDCSTRSGPGGTSTLPCAASSSSWPTTPREPTPSETNGTVVDKVASAPSARVSLDSKPP